MTKNFEDVLIEICNDFNISKFKKDDILNKTSSNPKRGTNNIFFNLFDYDIKSFFELPNHEYLFKKYYYNRNESDEPSWIYNCDKFSLADIIWNNVFRISKKNFELLFKIIPYLEKNNSYYRRIFSQSFNEDFEFKLVDSLLKNQIYDLSYDKFNRDVIDVVACRSNIPILELINSYNLMKIDRILLEKVLVYGRYEVLQFLISNFENDLVEILKTCNPFDLQTLINKQNLNNDIKYDDYFACDFKYLNVRHVIDPIENIWCGNDWYNDECDKPIINKKYIDHIRTNNMLIDFANNHNIILNFGFDQFMIWYKEMGGYYAISAKKLCENYCKIEPTKESIRKLKEHVIDDYLIMSMVNESFTDSEIVNLLIN